MRTDYVPSSLRIWLVFLPWQLIAQTNYDFNFAQNNPVYTLAVQSDGKILVGNIRSPLRLNPDGTPDSAFSAMPDYLGAVYTIAVQDENAVLVGGDFTQLNGQAVTNLALILANGSVDPGFTPGPGSLGATVFSLAAHRQGKLLVGGNFSNLGGHAVTNLGRLNSDGTLDTTFVPPFGSVPFSLAVQPDGKILVGGDSVSLAGVTRGALARLNADGSLDSTFQPLGVRFVDTMVLQLDGKVVVGGRFVDQTNNYVRRFNNDGSVDTSFLATVDGPVYSVALQTDGKMLVGGVFRNLDGEISPGLGRLNPNGTRDTTFNPIAYEQVTALGLQMDGKILIGGSLATVSGSVTNYIGRLQNTGPATQSLESDGASISWWRGGTSPEICRAEFYASTNENLWVSLGSGTPIPGGWQLTGVSLPAGTWVRARGWVAVGQFNGPSWFTESTTQVLLARPIILIDDNIGFKAGQFGFKYSATGPPVVVEASSNLTEWIPLVTNTVTSGSSYFSDPQRTNYPARFYRIRSQ